MASTSKMDWSHHINAKSKARHPSPLKDIVKYMEHDGMISLAGGLPHPSLFPIKSITFNATTPDSHQEAAKEIQVPEQGDASLAQFIQYGNAAGHTELRNWCQHFTEQVHKPARHDSEILVHTGNTNAWAKVVGILVEDGSTLYKYHMASRPPGRDDYEMSVACEAFPL